MRRKHTKEIDRLAADICWAEFPRRPTDTTKRAYWAGVHPDRKAEYIEDARWLIFMACRLGPERMGRLTWLWEAVFPTDGAEPDRAKVRTPQMTDEQSTCDHDPEPMLDVCRKCRLSARAFLTANAPWLGILDSVRFAKVRTQNPEVKG